MTQVSSEQSRPAITTDYKQRLQMMVQARTITQFHESNLLLALNDEPIVKAMAISFIKEPAQRRNILQVLINRYNIVLGPNYAKIEELLQALLDRGVGGRREIKDSAGNAWGLTFDNFTDSEFLKNQIAKIQEKGERTMIRKSTAQKINRLAEKFPDLPKINL